MKANDRFLSNNLTKYKYASDTRADVNNTLGEYKDLHPKLETFTFNDGTSCELMCLEGTIPVRYLNETYNIPIAIFLFENYPHKAPIVYVRPTSSMQIKSSDYVDNNGHVQLPYIEEWRYPGSDLVGLVGVLQVVFGEKSPVFSKAAPPPPPTQNYDTSAYPYTMPLPPAALPPSFVPAPPHIGTAWQSSSTAGIPMPQPPSFAQANIADNLNNSPLFHSGGGGMSLLPGLGFVFPQSTDNPPPVSQPGDAYSYSLTDDHIRLSLRSAVCDKLRRCQAELHYQYRDELEALKQTQGDLQRGNQTIMDMLARMESEQRSVTEAYQVVRQKNIELSELLHRLKDSDNEPINVDEAVDTTAPLYRQLVSAFAEEQAIEDAIYYLGEAIGKNASDLDLFLKKVRELSRRQFMLRATVKQCREKAGLPTS